MYLVFVWQSSFKILLFFFFFLKPLNIYFLNFVIIFLILEIETKCEQGKGQRERISKQTPSEDGAQLRA